MAAIDLLVLDGAGPGALGLTLDSLDAANRIAPHVGAERLDWRVLSVGRSAQIRHGMAIPARPISEARARDVVVALGIGAAGPEEIERRLAQPDAREAAFWLRSAHRRGATLAAACTAVFLLGEAGALDGRRCTTTWWLSGLLAQRQPAARVDADALVLEDSGVWTAGAMTSQLDLMMALIERFGGAALAKETARRVLAPARASQAPYISARAIAPGDEQLAAFEAYVARHFKRGIVLEDAARALNVSSRTLQRRIRASTGLSPRRFVQKIRLGSALHLIEGTRLPLDSIAERVGLADAAVLHRLVVRHTGQSPGQFRARQR
ncbi:MAG: helix-turn-helix domain-containing protein [Betaproteobacteria bacterium]|nr:helix-turn-helix domain-containing protein [Betaproteobacteria bacterium]